MKLSYPAYSRRLGLFTALASAALCVPSLAQTVWSGNADNEFNNASNWTPATTPGTGDTAIVDTGSPQVASDVAIGALNVGGGNVTITDTGILTTTQGTTINAGTVSINDGGVLNSDVSLNDGGLTIDGALNGHLTLNKGGVNVNGTLGSATVGNTTVLSNNGEVGGVDVSAGGSFINNTGASAGAVTNAGNVSNSGTVESLTNTAGNFTNNADGRVTGKTVVTGGSVTNNFVITDADVAATASFTNNTNAVAGAIRNAGTSSNAGTIASLRNEAGTFINNTDGEVLGDTIVSGGTVTNNATLNSVNVGADGKFTNTTAGVAGAVTNAGTASNAGTIASLLNTAGEFTNNTDGRIDGDTVVAGGRVTNNFVISDADVAAAAEFVNNSLAKAGNIRNAGTVTNAGEVASLVNNAGTFTNNTGGTVTGQTTVTGGSVVNNAALADVNVGAAGRFTNNNAGTAGTVTNAGVASNDGIVAALSNTGGTFSNTGTISGAATVSGGALVNDGSILGAVEVLGGGVLAGTGSLGGLVVGAGGVLSPGPGIATLNVTGDVTFSTGSTYQADIDASGLSDRVDALGTIAIDGGTLDIRAASGNYNTTTSYTILNAAGITGTFDAVTSRFAFLSPDLTYGAGSVDLRFDRNTVLFSNVSDTRNGRSTAAAVEALGTGNPLYDTVLSLDAPTARSAFSQLSGEVHASLRSELLWDSRLVRDATIDEALLGVDGQFGGLRFWTSGFLASNTLSGGGNAADMESRVSGGVLGVDGPVSDQWRIGAVLGYTNTSLPQADTDSYHIGVYTAGEIGPLNIAGGAIYARNDTATRRDIAFGTFADRLTADYASATSQAFADFSWAFDIDSLRLQPFVNLAYVNLDTDAFRESGNAAALSVASGRDAIMASTVGVRWSMDLPAYDMPVSLSGMVGWRHVAGDLVPSSRMAFTGGSPFIIEGVGIPRDTLVAKVGVSARLSKSARLMLSYSGEFGKGSRSSTAQADLLVNF